MRHYRLNSLIALNVCIFCLYILVSFVYAAIWENIPALPQAQRVKQEEALVNNNPVQTTVYSTLATPQEIVEFYKTKLINFGWRLETETAQQGVNLLVFSKEDKSLNITVQNILGKNFITIMQSSVSKEPLEPCPECEKKLEELKKELKSSKESEKEEIEFPKDLISKEEGLPKEDTPGRDLQFVPRYPGAVRVNNVERESGKKVILAYYAQDSVETVTDFYLRNMGNYYWQLENEVDFQNLPEALTKEINVDIKGKSLVFKSPTASCIISITEEPQNKGTIIGVNYNEK